MLAMPTQQAFQYRTTAYSYGDVCAALADLSAAYDAFLPVCGQFNDMFTARYFSHIGPYFVTDKDKIDADYEALSKLRQATYDIDDPPMSNGLGFSHSGGSQEAYPIKKWNALARRYRSLTKRLQARIGA